MKPRNGKRCVASRKRDVETAPILSATAKITMDNAATPLLKLPQEVKNMIYEHVLPAHEVIYVDYSFPPGPGANYTLGFATCRETAERHCYFSLSCENWHSRCYTTESQGPHRQYPTLDLALLSTCRQTYDEAKYTLYGTNAFAFGWWDILLEFIRKYGKGTANNLPIRNIRLFINVEDRRDEECWSKIFKHVTRKLPSLKNVCVTVDEGYCLRYPFNAKEIFLNGILKLRDLQLSSFVLDVIKGERSEYDRVWISERMSPAQRVDWANYVKSAIMGPETNTVAR